MPVKGGNHGPHYIPLWGDEGAKAEIAQLGWKLFWPSTGSYGIFGIGRDWQGRTDIIDIGERQEVGDIEDWRVLEESCDVLEGVYGGIHGVSVVGGNISVSI
jgi:hypothetical protein